VTTASAASLLCRAINPSENTTLAYCPPNPVQVYNLKRLEPHPRCGSSLSDTEPESACRREGRSERHKLEPGASVIRCRMNSITALFGYVLSDLHEKFMIFMQ